MRAAASARSRIPTLNTVDCSVKRGTLSGHGIAAVVHLTRCAKAGIRFCAPLDPLAVYKQRVCDAWAAYLTTVIYFTFDPLEFSAEKSWIYKMGGLPRDCSSNRTEEAWTP